ncbi:DUF3182 family protein [Ochrobactrum ciceri]|uniref:DUF3182 family protein n=1 Tax=Brucella ciceri TaxID=391287 RepID=A0ABX1DVD4_9HYPH|nr:DUF3182 family protein [Brucella ciceri]
MTTWKAPFAGRPHAENSRRLPGVGQPPHRSQRGSAGYALGPHRPATTSHWARLRRRWRNVFIPTYALARQEGNPDMTVDRFYGGIVHRGFMATKLVTHPHWHDHDDLPEGWTGQFAACLQDCVLPGFSVFSHRHALEAASALLKKHKIRFKNPMRPAAGPERHRHRPLARQFSRRGFRGRYRKRTGSRRGCGQFHDLFRRADPAWKPCRNLSGPSVQFPRQGR